MKEITADDLRRMDGQEGLILQGCGGDLQEWENGINDALTEEGILLNGSKLRNVQHFEHDGASCLLFPFEGAELDIGKLAMWRLQTHGNFGGTWLSDYVPNRLGGFVPSEQSIQTEKPDCPLIGEDGNIFNLLGIASRTLKHAGQREQAEEMMSRVTGGDCHDYYEALGIIGEYVNITAVQESQEEGGMSFEQSL